MTVKAIRYRTGAGGKWQVVLPGVYASERGPLSDRQRAVAAFLYARRPIAITGRAAMAWHGFTPRPGDIVEVLVPLHYRRSDAGFARLRCTSVMPGVAHLDGAVTYVPLDRAIADTARSLTDMAEIRDLVASGVQRGKVEIWQLTRELDVGPMRGSARLREALAEVSAGLRSVAEADLHSIIGQYRLPKPLYNPSIFVGEAFLARPDAWWPELRRRGGGRLQGVAPVAWRLGADHGARQSHDSTGHPGTPLLSGAAAIVQIRGRQDHQGHARAFGRPAAARCHARRWSGLSQDSSGLAGASAPDLTGGRV